MAKPLVTLTLAGDESKLTQAFARVGESSKKMATDVGASSRQIAQESGEGFDRAAEGADNAEGRAQGFSDTLTGTKDLMSATGEIARGNYFEGFVMAGQGAADLAGGLASFVIPAVKNMSLAMIGSAASAVKNTAAMAANKAATLAGAVAANVMTVAQKALNVAMRANPIGLIITALILLVTGLVLAYKKSETFRNIVNGAFRAVRDVAVGIFTWIKNNWQTLFAILTAPFSLMVKPIWKHRDSILGAIKAVPGAIAGFMRNVAGTITAPFQAAFNGVRNAWNNTVGGKGFTVPGWVPNIGGLGFSIPFFHTGGVVSGAMGSETLAVLKAGERVTGGSNSGAQGMTITFRSDGTTASRAILEVVRKAVQIEFGGNVDAAFAR